MSEELEDFVPENMRQLRRPDPNKAGSPRGELPGWAVAGILGLVLLAVCLLTLVFVPDAMGIVLMLCVGVPVYFLPTMVAIRVEHHNSTAIAALNLLLGWTFLGWALALVWALTKPKRG